MKPGRILVVLDHVDKNYGGLESWADQWTRWLAARGHEVHVAAFDIAPGNPGPGIIPHLLPRASGRLGRAAEVERFARQECFDIIHDLGVGWHFNILQPQAGSRVTNARQDLLALDRWAALKRRLSPWNARRNREYLALEKRQYGPGAGIIIAVSRLVADDLRRRYDVDPGRIRIVHNGIDLKRLEGLDPAECRAGLRKSLGLHDQVLFLFAGHNFRLKGLGPAIEALSCLRKAGRSCHLAVIGRGPGEEFRALASRRGVSDRISFHGPIVDVRPFFHGADAFLLPSFHDACSLAVEEAWACGLPVITTRFAGIAELMTPGVEGWVLEDPRDARAMAGRMESLLDPGLRSRMSASARELGARQSLENNFSRIEEILPECPG